MRIQILNTVRKNITDSRASIHQEYGTVAIVGPEVKFFFLFLLLLVALHLVLVQSS